MSTPKITREIRLYFTDGANPLCFEMDKRGILTITQGNDIVLVSSDELQPFLKAIRDITSQEREEDPS